MGALGNIITRIKAVITADNKDLKKKMKETRDETKKTGDSVGRAGKLIKAVMGAAVVAATVKLVKNMAKVRMEFEKYEAMLKVALGSQDAARESMKQLAKFAAETPFQLNQLTGAYVKLVNQGFKPTEEQMRSLGDLASAMGKDFDQLTEAIIDAQTGEFERLKEFGVRAKKEGDKVTFTFKEQETQVDFTASAIQGYVLGLGNMEGVSGSMAEISKTLGGRVSNLGDAWDSLMNTMGSKSSGVMVTVINWMIDVANGMQMVVKGAKQLKDEVWGDVSHEATMAMQEIKDMQDSMVANGMDAAKAEQRAKELYIQSMETRIAEQQKLVDSSGDMDEKMQEYHQRKLKQQKDELAAVRNKYDEVALLEKKSLDAYKAKIAQEQALQAEKDAKALGDRKSFYWALEGHMMAHNEAMRGLVVDGYNAQSVAVKQTNADLETYHNNLGALMEQYPLIIPIIQAHTTAEQQAADAMQINIDAWNKKMDAVGLGAQMMTAMTDSIVYSSTQAGASFKTIASAAVDTAKTSISAAIAKGVAGIVSSALETIPFPFGLIAAGIAGGAAAAIFNAAIPSFAEGGMVTGPTLAMVGDNPSGTEVIIPWERIGELGTRQVEVGGVLRGSNFHLMNKRYEDKLSRTGRI